MKLLSRAARALLVLLAAAAPARAAAQESEAWVLPRGLLEVGLNGSYTGYDARLDGAALGAELFAYYQNAADRLLDGQVDPVRTSLADLFANTPDPQAGEIPDSVTAGTASVRFAGDERRVPFNIRYGMSDRLTIFATIPLERSGTVVYGPYLAGGTLGLNPNAIRNRAVLAGVDPRYGELGGGLLLPLATSAEGIELQSRLRAINPADTLVLPTRLVTLDTLLDQTALRSRLTEEQIAALGLNSTRRPYHLGDIELGARFLLIPGPAGWPFPDSVVRRSLRTTVGVRARLPTGRGNTLFATELPPMGGHFGVGVDLLNDVFLSRRWYVNVAASGDWLLPADVQRQAFGLDRPFPVDTALRTLRRAPGPRVALSVTPRWRLTDEISFHGEYALRAQARTTYEAPEGVAPGVFEWRTGGAQHALGLGMRYSSLQAFARGRARVPFEVALTASEAMTGTMQAPDAFSVRFTARIFMDPRRIRALLPRDSVPPPPDNVPAAPADTVPVATPAPETPPATPPAPPPGSPITQAPWQGKERLGLTQS